MNHGSNLLKLHSAYHQFDQLAQEVFSTSYPGSPTTKEAAREFLLKTASVTEQQRKLRLNLCTEIAKHEGVDGNHDAAEKYATRAYGDIRKDTLGTTKELILNTLFIIHHRQKKQEIAAGFLKQIISGKVASSKWMWAMIQLGLLDEYHAFCDPFKGVTLLRSIQNVKATRTITHGASRQYSVSSDTDIGLMLKRIWSAFSMPLSQSPDISDALEKCSRLITLITKYKEDLSKAYDLLERLVNIGSQPLYHKLLTNLLNTFDGAQGKEFWTYLTESLILGKQPVQGDSHEKMITYAFIKGIQDCGVKGVAVPDLLPGTGKNADYFHHIHFIFFNTFEFVNEYRQWLLYLERTQEREVTTKSTALFHQGISSLPDSFNDAPACEIPDWIYKSTAPSDWSTNFFRYLLGIDLPKNNKRAYQYAVALQKVLPEKGALALAIYYMENKNYEKAINTLVLPDIKNPALFLLTAEILRSRQGVDKKKNKRLRIEAITHNYEMAGKLGSPLGYAKAAEFLTEKHPKKTDAWKKSAKYYSQAAILSAGNTEFEQMYWAMSYFCEEEADNLSSPSEIRQAGLSPSIEITSEKKEDLSSLSTEPGTTNITTTTVKHASESENYSTFPTYPSKSSFWKCLREINCLMYNDKPSNAQALLSKLTLPAKSPVWIKAMLEQNRAWCCKKLIENHCYQQETKFDERQHTIRKTLPPPNHQHNYNTHADLLSLGFEFITRGFKALGVEVPLDQIAETDIDLSRFSDREQRQLASLISTLAHLYSHCGEYHKSLKIRNLYPRLYSIYHQLRESFA